MNHLLTVAIIFLGMHYHLAAAQPSPVTAAAPPVASTGASSAITKTGATLSGIVNPNGSDTTVYFDYGTTTTYDFTVTHGSVGAGTSAESIDQVIEELKCDTSYHYRVRGENSKGQGYGVDGMFTTAVCEDEL